MNSSCPGRSIRHETIRDDTRGHNVHKLTGIIVPAEWNENGIPVEFSISTPDEMVYPLRRQKGLKASIKSILQREVELLGDFREEKGEKIFFVTSYKLIRRKKNETNNGLQTTS